jgi:peptide/nickel transport system ATP-binding protein
MRDTSDVLLSVKNLTVEYASIDGPIRAVNDVSFDLHRGEMLGLVGETGAGKTTIAKSILRLLPASSGRILDGEICFKGQDILTMSDAQLRRIRGGKISIMFSDPVAALNPTRTVGSQIAEVYMQHQQLSTNEAMSKAAEMLKLVGISVDRLDEYPYQFSTGMKQRVVIAMALACDPDLLIADEPTTSLDVTTQAQVLDVIAHLRAQEDTSMLLITHDLGIVAENCDRVAVVYAGEIVESGSIEEIFDNAQHPFTLGLFAAHPSMSNEFNRLSPIVGTSPDPLNMPEGCSFNPRCPYATAKCRRRQTLEMIWMGGTHYCRCRHVRSDAL